MINKEQFKSLLRDRNPKTAIILGSGLKKVADSITNAMIIKYKDIEGFPQSTVEGHLSQMVIGTLGKREVLCMQGRFHLYEGYEPYIIADMVQALRFVGIEELIITNAAGSLNPEIVPGDIMLIKDHINFSGRNPLSGPNVDAIGPRFVDMSNAYDRGLRAKVRNVAANIGLKLKEGVYIMVLGPNFETAAEIKAFRLWGGDAVGMSTVPEVLSAVHCGIKVVAFSIITNFGTGMNCTPLSHEETLAVSDKAAENLTRLIQAYVTED